MSTLSISLFGTFKVHLDGEPVSGFSSRKAQALLAYLAVEPRPHTREELAGLLWPDYPEKSARINLRSALANVRRVIDDRQATPPHLLIDRQTIQFNAAGDHHLDVSIFESLAQAESVEPSMVPQLDAAVAQLHGPLMAGFSLSDSPAFEEWLLLKREYFNRQAGKALRFLTRYYSRRDDYAAALAHARRWIEADPWQEEAHRQVMQLLASSGRRSDALAHYAGCRRVLQEELGVEPADETTQLYERIRSGALEDSSGDGAAARQHTIPRPLTPLIGREAELKELRALLADADVRLLTIVGPGGIGKTHLALEAANSQESRFRHGVALVSLAPIQSAAEVVSTLAAALHFSFYGNVPAEEQILNYLREKELLLVMDNFEHLLEGATFALRMLESTPGLKILATSRIRLHIRGEQLYPLTGLAHPTDEELVRLPANEDLHRFGALKLFMQQARRLQPSFALSPETVTDVARICRLVEGVPLGIVLASAWSEILSPGEIAAEIERSFTFLRVDGRGLPARQQNLELVFEHTWSLLTEHEKAIFQRSSVFRGGFTLSAAEFVTGATLSDLLALSGKFLLHRSARGRYTIHELLRQFAAQKLARSPEDEAAVRSWHAAFYCAFLEERGEQLKGTGQQRAIAEIEEESANVRTAWRWAVEQRAFAQLDRAVNSLGIFYEWRGRYHEGEAACRIAVERLQGIDSSLAVRVRIKILNWQALFCRHLGQSEIAKGLVKQSLSLLNESTVGNQDVHQEKAAALLELGQLADSIADSKQLLEQALTLYRSLNAKWRTARTLYALGQKLGMKSAYEEKPEILEESLQLRRSLGDQRGVAEVLGAQGFHEILTGRNAQGIALLQESCAISQRLGDRATLARSLARLGVGYDLSGKFADAFDAYDRYLQISQDLGRQANVAGSQAMISESCSHMGRYNEAQTRAEIALEIGREINEPAVSSYALWFLGFAKLARGAAAEAVDSLTESISMHEEIGWPSRKHDVRVTLGFAYLKSGEFEQAEGCLIDVLQMARENYFFRTSVEGIALAACFTSTQEEPELAVELDALAQTYPYIANSCWFRDVAGPFITAAEGLLPPAEVKAARERGRSRERWATVAELVRRLAAVS